MMTPDRPPLLVIVGPTGVGKTAAAVALGQLLPIEVISADSRQVYRGMDIATGKPSPLERQAVAHHLIDVVDPDDGYHAARFRAEAEAAIADIRRRGRLPVIVGGTGLYIRALLRGLDAAPPADPDFRRELTSFAAREGRPALYAGLVALAPAVARGLHPNDEVRVIRALERLRAGAAAAEPQARWQRQDAPWCVTYIGLTLDRQELARRLAARAESMVSAGLLDEVRQLLSRGYGAALPAMQGIGYRQFVEVAAGRLDGAAALALMQRDTVRYAKRQMTWFVREPDVAWIDVVAAGGANGVAATIAGKLDKREGRIG
jgi:tRNA dimethylallyltransferase